MREWIKQHPWQMEIVPFLSFVLASAIPLMYRQQSIHLIHSQHGFSQTQTWWGWYVFGTFVLVASFICNIYCNHLTIQYNMDTRQDWHLSVMIAFSGLLLNVFMLHFRVPGWVLSAWAVLLICSFLIQPWLRKTVPQAPPLEMPSCDLTAVLGHQAQCEDIASSEEPFYYRESLNRHVLLSRRFKLASWVAGALILIALWWTSKSWWDMAWPILLFAILELWDRRQGTYFMITPQHIKAWVDTGKLIKIRFTDVRRCEVVQAMPRSDEHFIMDIDFEGVMNTTQSDPEKMLKEHPYLLNIERLLEIETKNGKTHKFRLRDPDKACKLINTALQGRTNA